MNKEIDRLNETLDALNRSRGVFSSISTFSADGTAYLNNEGTFLDIPAEELPARYEEEEFDTEDGGHFYRHYLIRAKLYKGFQISFIKIVSQREYLDNTMKEDD